MTTSKLPSLIDMRSISKGWFNKIRVQPWITVLVSTRFPSAISIAEVEEDDRERACFLGGKISLGRKKSQDSNIDDSGNTGDGGKIVGGANRGCGCGNRYLDKSSEGLGEVFPGEAGNSPVKPEYS
ncbi:hypothetical protein Tco_0574092 [Tanacetum coccineum]